MYILSTAVAPVATPSSFVLSADTITPARAPVAACNVALIYYQTHAEDLADRL